MPKAFEKGAGRLPGRADPRCLEGGRRSAVGPYGLVAADMDGTLLDGKGEIAEETVREIRRIVEAGVLFVVTTGRAIQGVEKYPALWGLKGPVVAYNGAMVVDAGTREILFERGLRRDDAAKIIELGRRRGTTMCIWSRHQLYGNRLDARIHEYKRLSGVEPLPVEDWEELLDRGIAKILWVDDEEAIRRAQAELVPGMFKETTACTSKPVFLEFFNSRASKAAALEFIGKLRGIRREEMMAIGDGANDLDMIRYAGMGVAMENAEEEVKRSAGFITSSNEEDGVGRAIRQFLG